MFWKDRIGRKEGGKKERKKKGSRKKRRKENRTMNELMEVGLREGKVFLTTGSILLFLFYLIFFNCRAIALQYSVPSKEHDTLRSKTSSNLR